MSAETFAEYAAIEAVNWSTLREMRRSPLHYLHRLNTPREDSARFALGRGAHTAILEPERFLTDYAVFEGARRAGKAWDAFEAENEGKTILKVDEFKACMAMRDAVMRHPLAMLYLKKGRAEESMTWIDPSTGLACKGRVDWISESRPAVVDLKTTGDIEERRFSSTSARLGYHSQLAFYSMGYQATYGNEVPSMVIAVEAEAPHDVAVFRLDEEALWVGADECKELLAKVAECRRTGEWPGRYHMEQSLRLPVWMVGDEEAGLTAEVIEQESANG